MTFTDLITEASVMAGITALGETLTGLAINYGLNKFNQMIDMWAADRLAIYRSQRTGPFSLVASTGSYAIGSGATWNTARPSWIDGAGIVVTPSATYPAELVMEVLTNKRWQEIVVKTVTSPVPRAIWYDRTFANGTIYVYPVPSSATPQIRLYLPIAVTEVALADIGGTVSLPPGYRMALISNLAVLLCLGLRPAPEGVEPLAIRSFGQLKSVNLTSQMDPMECEEAVLAEGAGSFNYYSGNLR